MDATIRIWNSRTGEQVGACRGHGYIVNSIVVSGDGRKIVSGSWDKPSGCGTSIRVAKSSVSRISTSLKASLSHPTADELPRQDGIKLFVCGMPIPERSSNAFDPKTAFKNGSI